MFELVVIENIKKLSSKFLIGIVQGQSKIVLYVKNHCLMHLVLFLSRSSCLQFNILSDITAVDYPNNKHRFEVVYSFLSVLNNTRVFIKAFVSVLSFLPTLSKMLSSSN
jgi:NADH:ubiquinone oxidoreductase subunit C